MESPLRPAPFWSAHIVHGDQHRTAGRPTSQTNQMIPTSNSRRPRPGGTPPPFSSPCINSSLTLELRGHTQDLARTALELSSLSSTVPRQQLLLHVIDRCSSGAAPRGRSPPVCGDEDSRFAPFDGPSHSGIPTALSTASPRTCTLSHPSPSPHSAPRPGENRADSIKIHRNAQPDATHIGPRAPRSSEGSASSPPSTPTATSPSTRPPVHEASLDPSAPSPSPRPRTHFSPESDTPAAPTVQLPPAPVSYPTESTAPADCPRLGRPPPPIRHLTHPATSPLTPAQELPLTCPPRSRPHQLGHNTECSHNKVGVRGRALAAKSRSGEGTG